MDSGKFSLKSSRSEKQTSTTAGAGAHFDDVFRECNRLDINQDGKVTKNECAAIESGLSAFDAMKCLRANDDLAKQDEVEKFGVTLTEYTQVCMFVWGLSE